MTADRDIARAMDLWLSEGYEEVSDRVLNVVEERIWHVRQRPGWRVSWRDAHMSTNLKVAAGLAAILVLVVAVWNLLPGRGPGVGNEPTPSPSPSAAPSPSTGAVFPDWFANDPPCDPNCAGRLSAGAHRTQFFEPSLTFTIPAGWINAQDFGNFFGVFPDTPSNEAEFARSHDVDQGLSVSQATPGDWADDWGICPGTVSDQVSTSAADIAGALASSENLITSSPVGVTIGGLTGQRVDVRLSESWTGTCPLDPEDPRDKDFTEIRLRLWLLDYAAGNAILTIKVESLHAAEFDTFAAEATPIVESFEFRP